MVPDNDEIIELVDAALSILKASGASLCIDPNDGVDAFNFANASICISLQPATAGAATPSWLDIWETVGAAKRKVFCGHWFAGRRDEIAVETFRASAWSDVLRELAAAPSGLRADGSFPDTYSSQYEFTTT